MEGARTNIFGNLKVYAVVILVIMEGARTHMLLRNVLQYVVILVIMESACTVVDDNLLRISALQPYYEAKK